MKEFLIAAAIAACLAPSLAHAQAGTAKPPAAELARCAQTPDPAACEARAAKRAEFRKQVIAACQGKEGAERARCVQEQRCARAEDPGLCRERAARRAEQRQKAHEACRGKEGEALQTCLRDQRPRRAPKPNTPPKS